MSDAAPLRIDFGRLEESRAEVRLSSTAAKWELVAATLYGPQCEFARTLPLEHRFAPASTAGAVGGAGLAANVLEPCYWSPELPFLYELAATLRRADGGEVRVTRHIGLRRWSMQGASFYLDRKRRVLRGIVVLELTAELIETARGIGASLAGPFPAAELLGAADLRGVALVVDLRGLASAAALIGQLSWRPAVAAAIVDRRQRTELDEATLPQHMVLATAAGPADAAFPGPAAIFLGASARPPAWIGRHDAPTIAVLDGAAHGTMEAARAACDQLQADLAPAFDLAGYFVTIAANSSDARRLDEA